MYQKFWRFMFTSNNSNSDFLEKVTIQHTACFRAQKEKKKKKELYNLEDSKQCLTRSKEKFNN